MKKSKRIISLAVTMMMLLGCMSFPTIATAESEYVEIVSENFEDSSTYTVGEAFVGKSSWLSSLTSETTGISNTVVNDNGNNVGSVNYAETVTNAGVYYRLGFNDATNNTFDNTKHDYREIKFSIKLADTGNVDRLFVTLPNAWTKSGATNPSLYLNLRNKYIELKDPSWSSVNNTSLTIPDKSINTWYNFRLVIDASYKTDVYLNEQLIGSWAASVSDFANMPTGLYFVTRNGTSAKNTESNDAKYYIDNVSIYDYTQAYADLLASKPVTVWSENFDNKAVYTAGKTFIGKNGFAQTSIESGIVNSVKDDNDNQVASLYYPANTSKVGNRINVQPSNLNSDTYSSNDCAEFSFRVKRTTANAGRVKIEYLGAGEKQATVKLNFHNNSLYLTNAANSVSYYDELNVGITAVNEWIDVKLVVDSSKNLYVYLNGNLKEAVKWTAAETAFTALPTGYRIWTTDNDVSVVDTTQEAEFLFDDLKISKYTQTHLNNVIALSNQADTLVITGDNFDGAHLPYGWTSGVKSDNFVLPTLSDEDVAVTWASSNSNIINVSDNINAVVTKPENSSVNDGIKGILFENGTEDSNPKRYFPLVDLTATLAKGYASGTKTIRVAVEPVYKSYFNESIGVTDSKLSVGVQNCFTYGDGTVACYVAVIRNNQLIGVAKATGGSYTSQGSQNASFDTDFGVQEGDTVKAFFWKPGVLKPYSKKLNVVYTAPAAE